MNILVSTLRDKLKANPMGLYVLFYTEMWELFGRFAITSLLVLYFTQQFHMSDDSAFIIYAAFIALIFATPIIGGPLADRYLGSRHAIIFGASIMVIGNACLIIPNEKVVLVGLAITAVGCGFFLPSIPPLVSSLYEHDESRRDAGFTLYYIGKNIGALLAPIGCGFIGQRYGYNYAFILSVVGMISGVLVFILGKKHLVAHDKKPRVSSAKNRLKGQCFTYLLSVVLVPLLYLVIVKHLDGYLLAVTGVIVAVVLLMIFIKRSPQERRHLIVIFIAIGLMVLFESFLGQGGTTLNLFIERNINRHLFGLITLPPSVYYAMDPVFMLIMGPLLAGLWMRLAARGKEPMVTTKFGFGLIVFALGFLTFVMAAGQARADGSASSLFVVLGYYFFPVAELCIIPISLSLVTKMAPQGLSALLVGVWMLSNAVSSYFTGVISTYGHINFALNSVSAKSHAAGIYQHLFLVSAIVMAITAVLAFIIGPLVKRLMKGDATASI
jgi:proton-dependent oligopeptide transporter, POT family